VVGPAAGDGPAAASGVLEGVPMEVAAVVGTAEVVHRARWGSRAPQGIHSNAPLKNRKTEAPAAQDNTQLSGTWWTDQVSVA
jgi:hypothetical protein